MYLFLIERLPDDIETIRSRRENMLLNAYCFLLMSEQMSSFTSMVSSCSLLSISLYPFFAAASLKEAAKSF
jgi:hypothetical protein